MRLFLIFLVLFSTSVWAMSPIEMEERYKDYARNAVHDTHEGLKKEILSVTFHRTFYKVHRVKVSDWRENIFIVVEVEKRPIARIVYFLGERVNPIGITVPAKYPVACATYDGLKAKLEWSSDYFRKVDPVFFGWLLSKYGLGKGI